jgi:hypothetical protein
MIEEGRLGLSMKTHLLKKLQGVIPGGHIVTNDRKGLKEKMIRFYRDRSDHENDFDQIEKGVKAFAPLSDRLLFNWAQMAAALLSRDLKAWFGLLLSYRPLSLSIVRMEFKRFLNTFYFGV